MVNPGSFQGARGEFLQAQSQLYADAVKKSHVADTVADIQRRYLKRFPVTMADDEEPSQEELANVDDNSPDTDLQCPDVSDMDEAAANEAMEHYEDLVARTKYKKDQIKRRLHYIYCKSKAGESSKNPVATLTSKLLGVDLKVPRKKTTYNVWGPKNRATIDPIVEARIKDLNAGKDQHAAIRSAVYKEQFEALPAAEQEKWNIIAAREHEKTVQDIKARSNNAISTSPIDRQRFISEIPRFVEPILDAIAKHTGWKVTLIAGGPEPADAGRLNMVSVHSGVTLGSVKMDFGRAEHAAYKTYIAPTFANFLKKCYTVQECRACVLPSDSTAISISDVAGDGQFNMEVHSFEAELDDDKTVPKPKRLFEDIAKSGKSIKPVKPTGTPSPPVRLPHPIGKKIKRALPTKDASRVKLGPSPLSQTFTATTSKAGETPKPLDQSPSNASAGANNIGDATTTTSNSFAKENSASPGLIALSAVPTTAKLSAPPTATSAPSQGPSSSPTNAMTSQDISGIAAGSKALNATASTVTIDPNHAKSSPVAPAADNATPEGQTHGSLTAVVPIQNTSHPDTAPKSPSTITDTPNDGGSAVASTADSNGVAATSSSSTSPQQQGFSPAPSPPSSPGSARASLPPSPCPSPPPLPVRNPSARRQAVPKPSGTAAVPDLSDIDASPTKGRKRKMMQHADSSHTTSSTSQGRGKRAKADDAGDVSRSSSKRKVVGGADGPSKKQRSNAALPPVGGEKSFEVALPALKCPPWVRKSLELLTAHDLGPQWQALVAAWLKFEQQLSFEEKRKPALPSAGRPDVISEWIKRARAPSYRPDIGNIAAFSLSFDKWWHAIQPEWRVEQGGGLKIGIGGEDWSTLRCSGLNGVLSAVAGLFFWGYVASASPGRMLWEAAAADVLYALEAMTT